MHINFWYACTAWSWMSLCHKAKFGNIRVIQTLWQWWNTDYLTDMLKLRPSTRVRRSSTRTVLLIPRTKCKSFGDRSFAVAGPHLWNDLPSTTQCAPSLQVFKTKLKTWLFSKYLLASMLPFCAAFFILHNFWLFTSFLWFVQRIR